MKSINRLIKFAGLIVLKMKTKTLKISDIDKQWWIADADSQILGRLASKIAQILKGKHKVNYVPHMDNGDCVVVVNAEKIVVTGNKALERFKKNNLDIQVSMGPNLRYKWTYRAENKTSKSKLIN